MTTFRPHRGMLADAMREQREFATRADLISHIHQELSVFGNMPEDYDTYDKTTKVEPYGYDDRIKWDTYIVTVEGFGVFGFTNGPMPE